MVLAAGLLVVDAAGLGGARPAEAQTTPSVLVSNLGQAGLHRLGDLADVAQSFRTGGHVFGYSLASVDLLPVVGFGADWLAKSVVTVREDSNGQPGSVVAVLADPPSVTLGGDGTLRFSAPGGGVDLERGTTYWLVIDITGDPVGNNEFEMRNSDAEDAGAASGWSIGDESRYRARAQTGSFGTPFDPLPIRLNGAAKAPSVPSGERLRAPTRFDLSSLDASDSGMVFRVCPDGVTCDLDAGDGDTNWVPSVSPVVVLREGHGPVSFQYRFANVPERAGLAVGSRLGFGGSVTVWPDRGGALDRLSGSWVPDNDSPWVLRRLNV